MTSSLVGSEMCIRDRCTRARQLTLRGLPPGHRTHRSSHRAGQPRRPPPVSYTHLTLPTICSV
eukprot:5742311-Prorocentrum_lima.AAC.1